jgi:hypothetical protein
MRMHRRTALMALTALTAALTAALLVALALPAGLRAAEPSGPAT